MSPRDDRGSAIVDFVLVGALVTLVFAGVVQLTLVLHVRNTLVDAAAEGARYAAPGRTDDDAVERASTLVEGSLAPSFAQDVSARRTRLGGLDVVEVEIRAPLPLVGLLGPSGVMTVRGHALAEGP
ncbi:TadE family protein [Cellulomonas massiliensis]|uniref:TadE family protein n=1 Tax=Cellulomonas massiliensis TaxID=1465811 RepID=UPI0002E80D1C|nr:TadE family protein [Cellulomonas massiliensis]